MKVDWSWWCFGPLAHLSPTKLALSSLTTWKLSTAVNSQILEKCLETDWGVDNSLYLARYHCSHSRTTEGACENNFGRVTVFQKKTSLLFGVLFFFECNLVFQNTAGVKEMTSVRYCFHIPCSFSCYMYLSEFWCTFSSAISLSQS